MLKGWIPVAVVGTLIFTQSCSTLKPKEDEDRSKIGRQLAEMNLRIDILEHRLSELQSMLEDQQESLNKKNMEMSKPADISEKTIPPPVPGNEKMATSAQPDKQPPVIPESAEAAYKKALSVYQAKDYAKAASMFRSIAENYPGHDLSDNALYWIGECRYAQKDYKGAIDAFKKVIRDYPKGSKVPDALLKIGYAYLTVGDRVNAQSFLKKVVKEYPFTPAAAKAGEMLKKIQTP